ncbi:LysR family transcriptional regulator [Serratia liquefaciens]|uniref:LysR family transcriptional regulator n=1 Tax=Serratia liquefaciens TaxID=614 RepID=UPI003818F558
MQNRQEALRIFCCAAEEMNFKYTAVRLRISPQKVTRAIKELESVLGEQLFHRNTRNVKITDFGLGFLIQAKTAIAQLDSLFQEKGKDTNDINGVVRITAPHTFGSDVIMPLLVEFARLHPAITLEFHLSNIHSNLVDEKIDIGIRIGFIHDQTCIARQPATMPFYLVASPELLKKIAQPNTIDDLAHVPLVTLVNRKTGRYWPWEFSHKRYFYPKTTAFVTDTPDIERKAVLAGLGFGQLAGYLVEKHIDSGELISVLHADAPPPWPVNLYHTHQKSCPMRIRLVFDYLFQKLAQR